MSKATFDIACDHDNGCLFLYQKIDECDKNHKEGDSEPSNEGRMYEIPGSPSCPVKMFLFYRVKLNPAIDDLWQRPKKQVHFFSNSHSLC